MEKIQSLLNMDNTSMGILPKWNRFLKYMYSMVYMLHIVKTSTAYHAYKWKKFCASVFNEWLPATMQSSLTDTLMCALKYIMYTSQPQNLQALVLSKM